MASDEKQLEYDVCLSFAGEDRDYVDLVAGALRERGIRVFYDKYEKASLWGKDLYEHLDYVYRRAARYCVLFASKNYALKIWTNHERKSAQARALQDYGEYVLPVRFDDTEIPGLRPTVGYIEARDSSPEQLAELVKAKLGPRLHRNFFPPVPNHLLNALGTVEPEEVERALRQAKTFFGVMERMTEQERRIIFESFAYGCPSDMPENMHISLDLLRRELGIPPSETLRILRSLGSLGFRWSIRKRPHDDDVDPEDDPIVEISWNDLTFYDWETSYEDDGFTMEVVTTMLQMIAKTCCESCIEDALTSLDFSPLSDVTEVAGPHASSKDD